MLEMAEARLLVVAGEDAVMARCGTRCPHRFGVT